MKKTLVFSKRFSIHFEARTSSRTKNHFAPLSPFDVLFFVGKRNLAEKFAPQEVPSRTHWGCEHSQLRTAGVESK